MRFGAFDIRAVSSVLKFLSISVTLGFGAYTCGLHSTSPRHPHWCPPGPAPQCERRSFSSRPLFGLEPSTGNHEQLSRLEGWIEGA